MAKLPVIVASGGVNTAGRTSHRHAHNRLVFDALGRSEQQKTLAGLSSMMDASEGDDILAGTLVRKITRDYFGNIRYTFDKTPRDVRPSFQLQEDFHNSKVFADSSLDSVYD